MYFLAGHILNMLFKLPTLSRDAEALENVQRLAMKFVKGLRYVPYEAFLQQLRLFSLTYRRIGGDPMPTFKMTHGALQFPMESIFSPSIHTGPHL